jgi:glucan phosphoethanolaminetransferase (alkaline phosphatase superfamily)
MSRVDRLCLAALAVMCTSPVMAMIIWSSTTQTPLTVISILLTAVLLECALGAATREWRRFFLVQLPLCLLSLGFVAYTTQFDIPPGDTLAQIVAGASLEEIEGFIQLGQGRWLAFSLAGWTVFYVALCLKLPRQRLFNNERRGHTRVLICSCAVAAAYCVTDPGQMVSGITLNPMVGAVLFLADDIPRANAVLHGSDVNKIPYRAYGSSGPEVHILVIGESARRQSWSAYGYGRATTPHLDARKGGIVLLQRAVADANLTNWSVPIILTGMPPDKFALGNVRGNLVDLAKEAGFSTAWLVNQDLNISTSIGINPDLFVLPPDPAANIFGRAVLDGSLVPSYQREINRSGKPRFIGIHMMGAHWEYYRRYTPAFEKFGSRERLAALSSGSLFLQGAAHSSALVDAYDNATLYTDWFLNQLIDAASALTVPATLLFFPDHGEDLQLLDGYTGHGLPQYTPNAFEIPAFVWVNEAFRKAHPEMAAALNANSDKEIRSHNIFYTEAQLMGITWPGADAAQSFASPHFEPDGTTKFAAGGVLVSRPQ